jgi:type II secretory pathway pseudopilin PulG
MVIGRNSTENRRRLVTFPSFSTAIMRSAVRLTRHGAAGSAGRCDRIRRSEKDHVAVRFTSSDGAAPSVRVHPHRAAGGDRIISVLAGILFPVFAKARASARKTTAISNLKQIGTALQMYTADYDEHLPNRWPIWNGYKAFFWKVDGGDLPSLLKPYVKNPAVWHSPEDRRSNRGLTSFALNGELAPGWPLSKIGRPAEAIYLTDRTDLDVLTIGRTTIRWTSTSGGGSATRPLTGDRRTSPVRTTT